MLYVPPEAEVFHEKSFENEFSQRFQYNKIGFKLLALKSNKRACMAKFQFLVCGVTQNSICVLPLESM